ncbi:S8 family serine peptidase [Lagierella sp.]|uniref:S8 family serine peptidase n=1 Tax=Lagierella sp. TaxID=2849657 RepID=UPI0026216293|nr:S8 family serine peptidase [Lagierella sp.]
MKKIVSILLAFVMFFSTITPVFAAENQEKDSKATETTENIEKASKQMLTPSEQEKIIEEKRTDGTFGDRLNEAEFGGSTRKDEGSIEPVDVVNLDEIKPYNELSSKEKLIKDIGEKYDKDKEYSFIVSLNTEYFSNLGKDHTGEQLRSESNKQDQIKFAKSANAEAKKLMEQAGIEFNISHEIEVIMVGFTGLAKVDQALKLADQEFIEEVAVAPVYKVPTLEQQEKANEQHVSMINSDKIVKARDLYKLPKKINGKGMVVAVLDSGFDVNHEAFYLNKDGKEAARFKSESDIRKAGVYRGAWFSDKIPFIHCYNSGQSTPYAMKSQNQHGQHVAGTAVGNETTFYMNGAKKTFKGIAPEAQLLAMHVFIPNQDNIDYRDVIAAMDDAIKLGADAMNLSLGSPLGQFSDDNSDMSGGANFTRAIEKASEAGSLVSIAGGNDSQFGYLDGVLPKATNPDYGVMGFPGNLDGAFTVASVQNEGNEGAGEMSAFSNWGVGADGNFKPDITAPGGNIISSINDNKYNFMSGTSMAAPHITGGAALIRDRVNRDFGASLTDAQKQTLVRNLLMSTAKPHINPFTKTYSSPRQQGAGVMDIDAASRSNVVLIGDNGQTRINLGDVQDTFDITFTVKNYGNSPKKYSYKTVLTTNEVKNGNLPYRYSSYYINQLKNNWQTDLEVKDGDMTLNPRLLKEIPGQTIEIPANSEKKITVKVDASEFKDELSSQMKEGYFLEGFVIFESNRLDPQLSMPFIGFRGSFNDLSVVEPFIYKLVKEGKKPHYYHANLPYGFNPNLFDAIPNNRKLNGSWTHLSTLMGPDSFIAGMLPSIGVDNNGVPHIADAFFNAENPFFITPVISPNGDQAVDGFFLAMTLQRNANLMAGQIYSYNQYGMKSSSPVRTLFTANGKSFKNAAGSTFPITGYSEQNMIFDGANLPDGKYSIDIVSQPVPSGARRQVESQDFYIDTQFPQPVNLKLENNFMTFDVADLTGVQVEEVYLFDGTNWNQIPKENGGYRVPNGYPADQIGIKLMDFGYNYVEGLVSQALGNSLAVGGSIKFKENVNPNSKAVPRYSYEIVSKEGEIITNLSGLKYTDYEVRITNIQPGYKLVSHNPTYVTLTAGEPDKTVELNFEAEVQKNEIKDDKLQTVSIGILNKHSRYVETASNAPAATVTIQLNGRVIVENIQAGKIDISHVTLKRGDKMKFIFSADGYKDATLIKKISR